MEELEIDFRAMTEEFTPADEKMLFTRNEQIRDLYCRMCFQCKGNFQEARAGFMDLPEEIRSIRCRDCSSCAIQCPNGVKVHERLIRAQELLA
jgi:uncharacterized protein